MTSYWAIIALSLASIGVANSQETGISTVGTWSTKSNKTLTGPGFYDHRSDRLIEPERTGISYSFTDNGFYESAYYRAISNPTTPECTKGLMQWQHGTFKELTNGSIVLSPIEIDGRQILSDPCNNDFSIYTRYNQSETFERAEIYIDPYHNIPRLNLYKFNGSPLPPMYLAFRPPQMLPTTTLHPLATASAVASQERRARRFRVNSKRKRNEKPLDGADTFQLSEASRWFWMGIACTAFGSALVLYAQA